MAIQSRRIDRSSNPFLVLLGLRAGIRTVFAVFAPLMLHHRICPPSTRMNAFPYGLFEKAAIMRCADKASIVAPIDVTNAPTSNCSGSQ